ncbi:MAG: hypothetical protein JSV91_00610, partial [Phycisphaerales bacterium]
AAVVRERVRRLIQLEEDPKAGLSIRYRRRLLDRTVRVILEQPAKDDSSLMTGRCDHYALVSTRTDLPRGGVARIRITRVTPTHTHGQVVSEPVALPAG